MATEALKSTIITARDNITTGAGTTPASKVLAGGILKESVATFEFAVADSGSTYRICEVPAHGRISEIFVKCDAAINSTGTIHIGIYKTTQAGGAVVDADCYATAIDLAAAAISTTQLNQKYEVLDIDKIEKLVWENAGVATSPESGTVYDLVATTDTAINTTGGTVTFTVRYVDGN